MRFYEQQIHKDYDLKKRKKKKVTNKQVPRSGHSNETGTPTRRLRGFAILRPVLRGFCNFPF